MGASGDGDECRKEQGTIQHGFNLAVKLLRYTIVLIPEPGKVVAEFELVIVGTRTATGYAILERCPP
jgi:hypothetical protein